MSSEGTRVSSIYCILVPDEDVVFSFYEGPSEATVRQLSERAGIPLSRIVGAIIMTEG